MLITEVMYIYQIYEIGLDIEQIKETLNCLTVWYSHSYEHVITS